MATMARDDAAKKMRVAAEDFFKAHEGGRHKAASRYTARIIEQARRYKKSVTAWNSIQRSGETVDMTWLKADAIEHVG